MQLPTFTDSESLQAWACAHADAFPRIGAEVLFAAARIFDEDRNDRPTALLCARKSIALFDQCSMDTLLECASLFVTILGKAMPSYIHQDVVRKFFPEA